MMLAKHGAKVLVNDVGSTAAGTGTGESPAKEVVGAIRAAGGEAAVNTSDVSDWAAASLDPTDIGARIDEIVGFTRANAGVDRNIWHRP
jgi:NAD(P)-dependent dehydrogenase (short-subunit alcohol dehydrogenase family)